MLITNMKYNRNFINRIRRRFTNSKYPFHFVTIFRYFCIDYTLLRYNISYPLVWLSNDSLTMITLIFLATIMRNVVVENTMDQFNISSNKHIMYVSVCMDTSNNIILLFIFSLWLYNWNIGVVILVMYHQYESHMRCRDAFSTPISVNVLGSK
jgi:hypothetical protein